MERRRLEAERASGSRSRLRPRPRMVSMGASAAFAVVAVVKTAVACETVGVVGEPCSEREITWSAEGARRDRDGGSGGDGSPVEDADDTELPWRREKYAGRLLRFALRWW